MLQCKWYSGCSGGHQLDRVPSSCSNHHCSIGILLEKKPKVNVFIHDPTNMFEAIIDREILESHNILRVILLLYTVVKSIWGRMCTYTEPDKTAATTAPGNFKLTECPAYEATTCSTLVQPTTEAHLQSGHYELWTTTYDYLHKG